MIEHARKSDLIDLTCRLHAKTNKAVRVSETGMENDAVWLPRSQIEMENTNSAGIVVVTMPEWLALDKGLI